MSSEKDPFFEIAREPSPSLPVVSDETIEATLGAVLDTPDWMNAKYRQLCETQPAMADQLARYIKQTARDHTERLRMHEVLVMMYSMLESQAGADAMTKAFGSLFNESATDEGQY